MSEKTQTLEQYLRSKLGNRSALSIVHLEKLRDGWESDNHVLTLEYGAPRTRVRWVWRIYSGSGSQAKAAREFRAMQLLHAVGYPVPQVILLTTNDSPVQ